MHPLIQKDFVTHMRGLAIYVKDGLPFASDLSVGDFENSFLSSRLASLYSMFCLFSLYWSSSPSLFTVFDIVSSNTDTCISKNPCANVFIAFEL